MARRSSIQLSRLEFAPVPEVTGDELDVLGKFTKLCAALGNVSFMPVVIRAEKGGLDTAQRFAQHFPRIKAFLSGAGVEPEYTGYLHKDPGGEYFVDNLTFHDTVKGSADAVWLDWPSSPDSLNDLPKGESAANAHLLFDSGLIEPIEGTFPRAAYRTTLNRGDVLMFDHTHPHAFRHLTTDRRSEAYYLHLPLPHIFEYL